MSFQGFLNSLKKPFTITTMPVMRKTAPSNAVVSIGNEYQMPAPNIIIIIPSITVMTSIPFVIRHSRRMLVQGETNQNAASRSTPIPPVSPSAKL